MTWQDRYKKTFHDSVGEDKAWKAFALVPMMLLNQPKGCGSVGGDEWDLREDRFSKGSGWHFWRCNMPKLRSGEVSLDVTAEQQRCGGQRRVVWSEVKCHGPGRS